MAYTRTIINFRDDQDKSGSGNALESVGAVTFPWMRKGGFGTATLTLAYPDMQSPPTQDGDLIEIGYDASNPWYEGVVLDVELGGQDAVVRLQGYPLWLLRNSYPDHEFASETLENVLIWLADNEINPVEPTALVKDISVPSHTFTLKRLDGDQNIVAVLNNLAVQFNCYWMITPDTPREFVFKHRDEISSTATYSMGTRSNPIVKGQRLHFGLEGLKNAVMVHGGWNPDGTRIENVWVENSESVTDHGEYRAPDIVDKTLKTVADCQAVGEKYLADRGNRQRTFRGSTIHNGSSTPPFPAAYRVEMQDAQEMSFSDGDGFLVERCQVSLGLHPRISWNVGDPKVQDLPQAVSSLVKKLVRDALEHSGIDTDTLGDLFRNPALGDLDMGGYGIDDADNLIADLVDGSTSDADDREWLNKGRLSSLTGDSGVIAVGDGGKIIHRGAASTWQEVTSGVVQDLNAVHGTSLRGCRIAGAHDGADMMILHYHSRDWERFTTGEVSMDNLNGIWSSSDATIWACGENGFLYARARDAGLVQIVASGAINLNAIYGTEIRSSRALGGCDVFAVGDEGRIFHYEEAGLPWRFVEQTSPADQDLLGVWGMSVASGYKIFAVGKAGTILVYDGVSWTIQASGTTEDLYAVWGSSLKNVFAVGTNGTVRHYNGVSWASGGWNIADAGTLVGISGTSYKRYFAVDETGRIWGRKAAVWTEETVLGGAIPMNAIFAVNADLLHRHGDEEEESGEVINEDNFATLGLSTATPQSVQATASAGAGTKASDDQHVHDYTLYGGTPAPLVDGGAVGDSLLPANGKHAHPLPTLEEIIGEEGEIIGLSEEKPLVNVDLGAEVAGNGEEAAPWNHQHPGITNPLSRALNCNWKDVYHAMLARCRWGNTGILEKGGMWRDDSANTIYYFNGVATYDMLFMR